MASWNPRAHGTGLGDRSNVKDSARKRLGTGERPYREVIISLASFVLASFVRFVRV